MSCEISNLNCCYAYFNPYIRPTRCSRCNYNLASNSPESIYIKQKIIQNTVRVQSSNYTMNLGSLKVYEQPTPEYGVNWKQMSDRKIPHIQKTIVPTQKSTKRSYTWLRPGSTSPGGVGVDMKHNSYDRYLARKKGKSCLRRGVIPPIVSELPFEQAFPIYGGKTFKTNIVSGYNCPDCSGDNYIYTGREANIFSSNCYYNVGDDIMVYNLNNKCSEIVKVIEVLNNGNFLVETSDKNVVKISCGDIIQQKYISGNLDEIFNSCDTYTKSCNICNDVDDYIIKPCS